MSIDQGDAFSWDRCDHQGIGKPGCGTCDSIAEHVRARLRVVDEWLRQAQAERDAAREREARLVAAVVDYFVKRDLFAASKPAGRDRGEVEHHERMGKEARVAQDALLALVTPPPTATGEET